MFVARQQVLSAAGQQVLSSAGQQMLSASQLVLRAEAFARAEMAGYDGSHGTFKRGAGVRLY
jgi:hypothetical protein